MGVKKKHFKEISEVKASEVAEPLATYFSHSTFNPALLANLPKTGAGNIVPSDPMKAIHLIKSGISKKNLDDLLTATGISAIEMSGYMHVSERTLRNYSSDTLLNPEMTERALEIAQLFERGCEVFGSLSAFQKYMRSEVISLGGQKPKAFLDTSIGIQFLLTELGRIEHGILA